MISKQNLQSIIAKYYLGEIEHVKWEIEDILMEKNVKLLVPIGKNH